MLPSVSEKLEANEKMLKKSMKKKKKKKKSRRNSSESSSSSEEVIKKKKKRKKRYSTSESSSSSSNEDEWIEKKSTASSVQPKIETPVVGNKMEREDWMSGMLIPTFSNKEKEPKKVDNNVAMYDPKTNSRELNPFWKDGGNGMPSFQKPKSDDDDDDYRGRPSYKRSQDTSYRKSGWRKRSTSRERTRKRSHSRDRSDGNSDRGKSSHQSRSKEERRRRSKSRDRKRSNSREKSMRDSRKPPTAEHFGNRNETESRKSSSPESKVETKSNRSDFLTDQQMNELGAKLLKAEILGNDELANSLKEKLEKAREYRSAHKSEILLKTNAGKSQAPEKTEELVMLTKTNSKGVSKPLSRQTDESERWGGRAGRKKNKKVETHVGGERVRYFADDDKYDIKQMVSFS